MRSRRVIDVSHATVRIHSVRGGLEIDGQRIPLEEVGVLLLGNRSSISGGALTMLSKYDVVILNCDWRGVPDLVAYGWSDNSRVASRHRAQAELTEPRRKNAWKQVVQAKIHGQANNLSHIGHPAAKRLLTIRQEVRSGDPSNCEALAAKIYWDALFNANSFQRVPGATDRLNSLLNYGYAILRGFVIQAIVASGLWPSYGIWHRNRSNTFLLADDLIEPFRAAVDFQVFSFPPEASLKDRTTKEALVSVTNQPLSNEGRTVFTEIHEFTSRLAQYCEGHNKKLRVPVWAPDPRKMLPTPMW